MDFGTTVEHILTALGHPGLDKIDCWFQEQRKYAESPRFRHLDRMEAFYYGHQYRDRKVNWDGRDYVKPDERASIMRSGPGDPLGSPPPWQYRIPWVRRNLCGAVVDRMTGLLFGEHRCPEIVATDRACQPWVDAATKAMRWPARWALARTLGGQSGSVVVVAKLRGFKPVLEVLRSKWCTPKWRNDDPDSGDMEAIEVLYKRPIRWLREFTDNQGARRHLLVDDEEFYRRLITPDADIVMTARIEKGRPLVWVLRDEVEHNVGVLPAVWTQNEECVGELDGQADCAGQWENLEVLDALLSDAFGGTHYNCDPTLKIKSVRAIKTIQTGSQSAIQLRPDEDAELMEMTGTGSQSALAQADSVRIGVLEDVRCVLASELSVVKGGGGSETATAVLKREGSMLERADELRRQYGDAMETLFERFIQMCQKVGFDRLAVPLRLAKPYPTDPDVSVKWPEYVQPTPSDEEAHVRKVSLAVTANLLSRESAVKSIAPFVGVKDVEAELRLLAIEGEQKAKEAEAEAFAAASAERSVLGDREREDEERRREQEEAEEGRSEEPA